MDSVMDKSLIWQEFTHLEAHNSSVLAVVDVLSVNQASIKQLFENSLIGGLLKKLPFP